MKLVKRISLIIAVLLIFNVGIFASSLFIKKTVSADDTLWDGTTINTAFSGTGTEEDPFLISSANQLAGLAVVINTPASFSALTYNNANVFYKLTTNVDLNYKQWTPIGNATNQFKANFNGNNLSISNLYMDGGGNQYCGLFGYFNSLGAVIENINLSNITFYKTYSGVLYVGGITGAVGLGTINNCSVVGGTLTGTTTVVNTGVTYIGGIVGSQVSSDPLNPTIIENCNSQLENINVTSGENMGEYIGGIVGKSTGMEITRCYSTSTLTANRTYNNGIIYIGGIVGSGTATTISKSFNTGTITISGTSEPSNIYLGGIVGEATPTYVSKSYAKFQITNYTTTATNYVGGIIGKMDRYGSAYSTIDNSYSYISNNLTTANSGNNSIGLLAGAVLSSDCFTTNSYYLSQSSYSAIGLDTDPSTTNNVSSLNSTQMTDQSSFGYFDFDTIWAMGTNSPISPILIGVGNDLGNKTITYNLNGGSWASGFDESLYSTYQVGTQKNLPTQDDITLNGYIFAGWHDNEQLTGDVLIQTPLTANTDLNFWAEWKLAVARINTTYFSSLTDAISSATTGDTIFIVVSNITTDSTILVSGKNLTIMPDSTVSVTILRDTINADFPIFKVDSGSLTLSGDNVNFQTITLNGEKTGSSTGSSPLILVNGLSSQFILNENAFVQNNFASGVTIQNGGKFVLNAGVVNQNNNYAVEVVNGTLQLNADAYLGGEKVYVGTSGIIYQSEEMTSVSPMVIVPQSYTEGVAVVQFATEQIVDTTLYSLQNTDYKLYTDGTYLKIGKEYDLTFYKNNGDSTSLTQTHFGGSQFLLKDFSTFNWTVSGYEFVNWNTSIDGNGTNYSNTQSITMPSNNLILYAIWQAKTYTITFNFNGATGGNTPASIQATFDSEIGVLPSPTKDGYVFDGWYWETNFQTLATSTTVYSYFNDTTLYAKFSVLIYDINLTVNTSTVGGGSNGAVLSQSTAQVTYGENLVVTLTLQEGYKYVNCESQNGYNFSVTYNEQTNELTFSNILNTDTIIVNVELQSFEVTLVGGIGGTPAFDTGYTSTVYWGNSVVINSNTNFGYRFDNWQISGTATINATNDPTTVTQIKSNVTITANYVKTYTLSLIVNGFGFVSVNSGENQTSVSAVFDEGTVVNISASTETAGQEFKRWTNDDDTTFSESAITSITLNADTNLTAVFGVIGYKVTINIIGSGEVYCNSTQVLNGYVQDVVYGDNLALTFEELKGHYLSGITETNLSGDYVFTTQEIADALQNGLAVNQIDQNLTFAIQFSSTNYTILLSTSTDVGIGGTALFNDLTSSTQTTIDDLPVSISATVYEGYKFLYWTVSGDVTVDDLNSVTTQITDINEDATITAHFEILKYTILVSYNSSFGSVFENDNLVESGSTLKANYGTNLTFTFTPISTGYFVDTVTLNLSDVTNTVQNNQLSILGISQDYDLSVLFDVEKFDVVTNCNFNDVSIELWANGIKSVTNHFAYGTEITVKSTYVGYQFLNYIINGTEYNTDNATFTITQDSTVVGNYLAQITGGNCTNGFVYVNGLTSGNYAFGETIHIKAVADFGYMFVSWNGIEESTSEFDLTVSSALTLTANFSSKPVTVTISTNAFGSVNGSSANGTNYEIGDVLNLNSQILYEGYEFLGWNGTFSSEFLNLPTTTYTITNQDAENGNVSFFANIEIKHFSVVVGSNSGGEINPSGTITKDYGDQFTVTYQTESYYYLNSITSNNQDVTNLALNGSITIEIKEDKTIYFNFAPIVWTNYFNDFTLGTGTVNSPYIISTPEQLAMVSYAINNGLQNTDGLYYANAHYKLTTDINLTGKYWESIGINEENKIFNGVFDFNYHKITNLTVLDQTVPTLYAGLFGSIGTGEVINQTRSYFGLIMAIIGGVILISFSSFAVILIEKKRRIPKKVFILPKNINRDNMK